MPAPFLDRTRAKSPTGQERRNASRQKAVADAWADPGGMEPAIPCKLLDISNIGAKLGVDAGASIPESFTLHAGGTKTSARVIWRRQNQVGVEFDKRAKR
jgi:hypothetical protein